MIDILDDTTHTYIPPPPKQSFLNSSALYNMDIIYRGPSRMSSDDRYLEVAIRVLTVKYGMGCKEPVAVNERSRGAKHIRCGLEH